MSTGVNGKVWVPEQRTETMMTAPAIEPNGTVLRPATVREWSERAGFASLRVLPVDHVFWRFYELSG